MSGCTACILHGRRKVFDLKACRFNAPGSLCCNFALVAMQESTARVLAKLGNYAWIAAVNV